VQDHLESDQLRKLALRFFLTAGDNADITARVELGIQDWAPTPTHQLDRGRLENWMACECANRGIEFTDGASVLSLAIVAGNHLVRIKDQGGVRTIHARWLIDASGRPGFLKRRLDLGRRLDHDINAAWFRVASKVDLDEWTDDADWRARVPGGIRWLSTNHLIGTGYWVWLIPLASGSTSIGVVADPRLHSMKALANLDRVLEWLEAHEPQCAHAVRGLEVQDFRVMHTWAYSTKQALSSDRWAITGEAAAFLDPLYSPGTDLIAIWNSLIGWVVAKDLRQEPIDGLIDIVNRILLISVDVSLPYWRGVYPLLGSHQAFADKLIWDIESYFSIIAIPYAHTRFTDIGFMLELLQLLARFNQLNLAVQSALLERRIEEPAGYEACFIDLNQLYLRELNSQILDPSVTREVLARTRSNVEYLAALAGIITGDPRHAVGVSAQKLDLARAELEAIRLKPAAP
jgi:hypothetical protein